MHVTLVVFIRKRQKPQRGRLMSMGADNKHLLLLLLALIAMTAFGIAQMPSFLWCQVTGMPPMVLIVTSICHVSRYLWNHHLMCLTDQGSVVPCVKISMVPTPHVPHGPRFYGAMCQDIYGTNTSYAMCYNS